MIKARKNAKYPVLLDCGHECLVSSATYFGGSAVCWQCTNHFVKTRFIVRAYTLRNANCVRVR